MKFTRLTALVAVPAALLISACSGGSIGVIGGGGGTAGQQANVRFVHGAPGAGNVDIYFQSNGSAAPSSPLASNVPFGIASDFLTLPNVAGSVIVQKAGGGAPSTGATQFLSCPVPQFANNTNYSIVIVKTSTSPNCVIFQDPNYTASNQYRFHHASPAATVALGSQTVTYGVATAAALPGATFSVAGTATYGTQAVGGTAPTYTVIAPATLSSTSNVSFAVGPPSSGAAITTLDAGAITLPGSATQPNSASNTFTLPSGYAGASIYAIDCTGATLPAPGERCTGGVALIGVYDSH